MGREVALINREGFWYSKYEPLLPKPVANEKAWKGKREFVNGLKTMQSKLNPQRFKGSSKCRICGCINGSTEFVYHGWRWPSGLLHYVEEHNVRPSLAFQELVVGQLKNE